MKENEDNSFDEIKFAVENGITDREFWYSRTPQERVWAAELMRQRKYGYDQNSVPRFERVFEVVDLKQYSKAFEELRHDNNRR